MNVHIFNVTHGFCAYIIADNHNVLLIDCGHNEVTGFRPSEYIPRSGCTAIEMLILSNYDNDHVSDLPNLRSQLPIGVLMRNKSISNSDLERIKREAGPLTTGLQSMLDMIKEYYHLATTPDYGEIDLRFYHNDYSIFKDTNNLSYVTFLHYHNTHFIFPGDLEGPGWTELLKRSDFCDNLRKVNIYIASHHGRKSGYCKEVFNYCNPEIILISDGPIEYDTQTTYDDYWKHASGIQDGPSTRYIYTTRSDGHIVTEASPNGATISTYANI